MKSRFFRAGINLYTSEVIVVDSTCGQPPADCRPFCNNPALLPADYCDPQCARLTLSAFDFVCGTDTEDRLNAFFFAENSSTFHATGQRWRQHLPFTRTLYGHVGTEEFRFHWGEYIRDLLFNMSDVHFVAGTSLDKRLFAFGTNAVLGLGLGGRNLVVHAFERGHVARPVATFFQDGTLQLLQLGSRNARQCSGYTNITSKREDAWLIEATTVQLMDVLSTTNNVIAFDFLLDGLQLPARLLDPLVARGIFYQLPNNAHFFTNQTENLSFSFDFGDRRVKILADFLEYLPYGDGTVELFISKSPPARYLGDAEILIGLSFLRYYCEYDTGVWVKSPSEITCASGQEWCKMERHFYQTHKDHWILCAFHHLLCSFARFQLVCNDEGV
ncbi:hypothetical protein M3Y99_00926600 [Aphelenchoides fujianensis]|nr:hypothetical protein M3Y99_00926600 [Aphelenchoides fujianensis]